MEYSEKEKKVIEELKSWIAIGSNLGNAITTLLNLIEKQQKEIEEKDKEIYKLKCQTQIISPLYVKENYISKEAIRELLKDEYNGIPMYVLNHEYLPGNLKSLLGE